MLFDAPLEKIRKTAGALTAEGIDRMRQGKGRIAAGYDGEYGKIHLFSQEHDPRKLNCHKFLRVLLPIS